MSAVVIWVADLARSVTFYSELFDTTDCQISDGFASVKGGGNEVLLHLLPEQYRAEPSIGEENPIKPIFQVNSLAKHESLIRGEVAQYGDWRYADLTDSEGHIIQIREKL